MCGFKASKTTYIYPKRQAAKQNPAKAQKGQFKLYKEHQGGGSSCTKRGSSICTKSIRGAVQVVQRASEGQFKLYKEHHTVARRQEAECKLHSYQLLSSSLLGSGKTERQLSPPPRSICDKHDLTMVFNLK
jgi:hypothetical protein